MDGYFISIHVTASEPTAVKTAVIAALTAADWKEAGDEKAARVVDNEDSLPNGDWYGLIVSGAARGRVSVWVADWQDSGWLARQLSLRLAAPVLEVWIAEDAHWGYTYFENGDVRDRFADDASRLAKTPEERALYAGDAEILAPVLRVSPEAFQETLSAAHAQAGQFPGGSIDALCEAVGLPFEHIFIAYEDFFEDDPEDYAPGLVGWPQFRHLAFTHPSNRERLSD